MTLINQGTINLGASLPARRCNISGELTGDVTLASGVTLTNVAGGAIVGSGSAAIEATLGPATVNNAGVIDPATDGVDLAAGGSVSNAAGGTIAAPATAWSSAGGCHKTNAGTIAEAASMR